MHSTVIQSTGYMSGIVLGARNPVACKIEVLFPEELTL
jgi:hypothetical protein